MKKKLLSGLFVAALAATVGISGIAAHAESRLWTVMVHLAYADGTSYDIPLASGVPMSEVTPRLQDCARAHWTGSVVRYHCYPVPE